MASGGWAGGPDKGLALSDEERIPGWIRPALAGLALLFALLTLATLEIEGRILGMPHDHFVAVPVAVGIMLAGWLLEMAGLRCPRMILAAVVVLPNLWLAAIQHVSVNFLLLLLPLLWITYVGSRAESRAALGLSLMPIIVGALVDATDGRVAPTAWISWSVAIVTVWLLARALASQQQLIGQLQATRADLARQVAENARLHEQAQRTAALEERQRLAREMHDSATQAMYSARMYAEAASRVLAGGDSAGAANYLDEAKDAMREALAELRLLIHDLRPSVLEEQGLAAALKLRLQGVEERAGLKTEFTVEAEGEDRLPLALEQELYRIAQEALNNALKHGRPKRVAVSLRLAATTVELEVSDDGDGFSVERETSEGAGLGLGGMRERAARLGGSAVIESQPGGGTRVRVEAPR